MNDENYEILQKISNIENLITKCYINKNIYESLNIFEEILLNLENQNKDINKVNLILTKFIEIFIKADNRTRECFLYIIEKYKNIFNEKINLLNFSENENNIITENLLKLLNSKDNLAILQTIELLNILQFLVDQKIKDTLTFLLIDDDSNSVNFSSPNYSFTKENKETITKLINL